jgi:uncharacterized protein (TIRG00374 family)
MRKIIFTVLVLVIVLFLITRFTEVQEIVTILHSGDWRFVALAFLVEVIWMASVATSYYNLYHLLGLRETRLRMFLVANAASFVNVMAPSGGMTALAIFLADARKRGHATGRVTIACILYLLFDYLGVLSAVCLGLMLPGAVRSINWSIWAAGSVLLIIVSGLSTLLILADRFPSHLARLVDGLEIGVQRLLTLLKSRRSMTMGRGAVFAAQISEGMRAVRANPKQLIFPGLLGLASKALLISVLYLMFRAFQIPFSPGMLITGFSLAYLFAIASPTPSGVGVVEGVLTLSLASLGLSVEAATLIALSYRGVTFWLPFIVGLMSFRRLTRVSTVRGGQPATAD